MLLFFYTKLMDNQEQSQIYRKSEPNLTIKMPEFYNVLNNYIQLFEDSDDDLIQKAKEQGLYSINDQDLARRLVMTIPIYLKDTPLNLSPIEDSLHIDFTRIVIRENLKYKQKILAYFTYNHYYDMNIRETIQFMNGNIIHEETTYRIDVEGTEQDDLKEVYSYISNNDEPSSFKDLDLSDTLNQYHILISNTIPESIKLSYLKHVKDQIEGLLTDDVHSELNDPGLNRDLTNDQKFKTIAEFLQKIDVTTNDTMLYVNFEDSNVYDLQEVFNNIPLLTAIWFDQI